MTDNTQDLDEILNSDDGVLHCCGDYQEEAKQAILDWHNKQVDSFKGIIKMSDTYTFDTGEVYYSQEAVDKQVEAVLDRLIAQQVRFGDNDDALAVPTRYIEAERNKLNKSDIDVKSERSDYER